MWLYHRVMSPKDADGIANSVDPDQTRRSLILVYTVCTGLYVRKLGIIHVKKPSSFLEGQVIYLGRSSAFRNSYQLNIWLVGLEMSEKTLERPWTWTKLKQKFSHCRNSRGTALLLQILSSLWSHETSPPYPPYQPVLFVSLVYLGHHVWENLSFLLTRNKDSGVFCNHNPSPTCRRKNTNVQSE